MNRLIYRQPRRRGYVLLLVLFVIALATVAMASVCRMSLEKGLQADRAQSDLQRRWAVVTCRSVVLPKVQALLDRAPDTAADVRRTLHLGRQSFTVIIADEQAKANVNLLYAQGKLAGAERAVRAVISDNRGDTPVTLRPLARPAVADDDDEPPQLFESFEQVFGRVLPERLVGSPSPTSALTCWGDGTLNLHRASPQAVRAVLGTHLPAAEIAHLLELRAKNPTLDSGDLLDLMGLSDQRREAVEELLTDQSACRSLWIISDSLDRKWYDLAVSRGQGDVVLFSW
jgi:type II secretory pathway component PulK